MALRAAFGEPGQPRRVARRARRLRGAGAPGSLGERGEGERVPELVTWSWLFLAAYVAAMLVCGAVGMRRVRNSDDFATARRGYGPLFLAFAMTATTASGATFLGLPGIAYEVGVPGLSYAFLYPVGTYFGILLCMRVVQRSGEAFGNRSIPEYLGDRYGSEFLRLAVAIFSLLLIFYLAAQIVAASVMFDRMLGLGPGASLVTTVAVLLVYVGIGGAHADILTDGIQGALMLLIALAVTVLFFLGYGVDGGFEGMVERLASHDSEMIGWTHSESAIVGSAWDLFAIVVAHIPLGLLPHIGNKLWALRPDASRARFAGLTCLFGMLLPALAMGGVLARAVLGDALLEGASNPNYAIPELFVAILPPWLAAFLGAGILAAVMSTADGLVISTSQIFANDIYRRTLAPRWHAGWSPDTTDRIALLISRAATIGVLLAALGLGWSLRDMNVVLLVWLGVGGMMSALAGPLVFGVLWRGATRAGGLAGFFSGLVAFALLRIPWLETVAAGRELGPLLSWLGAQSANVFSCATLGGLVSVATTTAVSLASRPLPPAHLERVFGSRSPPPRTGRLQG